MGQTTLRQIPYPEGLDAADVPVDMKEMADTLDTFGYVPVGAMMIWALAGTPDANWLLCDGTAVPAAYPLLRALMVNTPNMQGRVIVGVGTLPVAGGGTYAVGSVGGEERHRLLSSETGMVPHSHGGATGAHNHNGKTQGMNRNSSHGHLVPFGVGEPSGTGAYASTYDNLGNLGTAATDTSHEHVIDSVQASISLQAAADAIGVHENRQPYVALNYIIRGR